MNSLQCQPAIIGNKVVQKLFSQHSLPNRRAMPDPVLSEAPPSIEVTLTVLFCIHNHNMAR